MVESHGEHNGGDGLAQRARAVVALARLCSDTPDDPVDVAANALNQLIFVTLANRTSLANARFAYALLRQRYATWRELVAASRDDVAKTIRPAGLAQQRAGLLQGLVARVLADFPNESLAVLRTWDDQAVVAYFTTLPGIGPLRAHQVMLYALDRPVLPATWALRRLLTRVGIVDRTVTLDEVLQETASLLEAGQHRQLHDALSAQARDVCTPRYPRCRCCHLADHCAHDLRVQHLRGVPRPREASPALRSG